MRSTGSLEHALAHLSRRDEQLHHLSLRRLQCLGRTACLPGEVLFTGLGSRFNRSCAGQRVVARSVGGQSFHTGRMATRSPGLGHCSRRALAEHEVAVAHGLVSDCHLERSEEEQAAAAAGTTVEALCRGSAVAWRPALDAGRARTHLLRGAQGRSARAGPRRRAPRTRGRGPGRATHRRRAAGRPR